QEILLNVSQQDRVKLVVLDLSTSANIDLAGVRMLDELHKQLAQAGVCMSIAEVHGAVRDLSHEEGLHLRIRGVSQRLGVAALIQLWEDETHRVGTYA